jgi:NitT/TauT family transport system substrate-binding protein
MSRDHGELNEPPHAVTILQAIKRICIDTVTRNHLLGITDDVCLVLRQAIGAPLFDGGDSLFAHTISPRIGCLNAPHEQTVLCASDSECRHHVFRGADLRVAAQCSRNLVDAIGNGWGVQQDAVRAGHAAARGNNAVVQRMPFGWHLGFVGDLFNASHSRHSRVMHTCRGRLALGFLTILGSFVLGCSTAAPSPPTTAPAPAATTPPAAAATTAPASAATTAPAPAATAPPVAAPTTAAASAATAAPAAGGAKTTIKIGLVAGTGATPVFVAQGRGYYEKQGLDVQFVTVSSGAELLPLMASNQLDGGISSPAAALFNAVATNVSLKVVADAGKQDAGAWWGGLVVRPQLLDDGTIKTAADLKGKTIAVTAPGVGTYMNTVSLLESNRMSDKDVNITFLNFADMLSALASGKIDAADMVEPSITQGEAQGVLKRWVSNAEIAPGEQEAVLMITPALANNTDVANRFILAYVQGLHDYRSAFGPEKTDQAAVISSVMPMLPSSYTADLVSRVHPTALDPDGLVNADSLKHQQDWYMQHGFVKSLADVDKLVDNSFVEHARTVLAAH